MSAIPLTTTDLALAASLVILLAVLTFLLRLGVGRSLLVAAARMAIQLFLIGFVLTRLFAAEGAGWILLMGLVMLLVAGYEVVARQERRLAGGWSFAVGTTAMFISSFTVTVLALAVMIGADPWYQPRYAIPVLGMLLGNTMTGVALACDRLTSLASERAGAIEAHLLSGARGTAALAPLVRESLRAGLVPTINAMAAAGIVSLPGMMTGQILSGSPPTEAVRYQILIWLLIASGTGFGMVVAVSITARRLLDERDRLRLDRLTARG